MSAATRYTTHLFVALMTAIGTWLPVYVFAGDLLSDGPVAWALSLPALAAGAWVGWTAGLDPVTPVVEHP